MKNKSEKVNIEIVNKNAQRNKTDSNVLKFIKRYKIFILLLVVNFGILYFLPEIGFNSFNSMWSNTKEMLTVIPPIFILLGLLDVWVDRSTMVKLTGKGSGIRGTAISLALGSLAAGPLYAAFPVASMMIKKGSSIYNVAIFVGAWSTTKIPMLMFEMSSLGIKFALVRMFLSIIGINVIAFIITKALNEKNEEEIRELNVEEWGTVGK